MGNITDYLKKILSTRYGKDMRQAIHDSIQQCYYDGKAGEIDLQARQDIEKLNESLAQRNVKTYNTLSQLGIATSNTVTELMAALPIHSYLQANITSNANTVFNKSLPTTGAGMLTCYKGNDSTRGSLKFTRTTPSNEVVYEGTYHDGVVTWLDRTVTNSDLETITDQTVNISTDNIVTSYTGYLGLKAGVVYANLLLNLAYTPTKTNPYITLFRFSQAKHPDIPAYISAIAKDVSGNYYNCVLVVVGYGTSSSSTRVLLLTVEESAVNVELTEIYFTGSWLPYREITA